MSELEIFYSDCDKKLLKQIVAYYSNREFNKAILLINERLDNLKVCNKKEEYFFKIELAGFLIDIGEEGRIKKVALEGYKIIESERENIKEIITDGSIEYNLGNAKSTLFKIEREEADFEYVPKNINNLIDAKNHYWRAYKFEIDNNKTFRPELVVNLANSMSNCGRIVESLQYYDLVLREYPDFPQANASRAKELLWLKELTGIVTQNLVYQAKVGYEVASETEPRNSNVPKWLISIWKIEASKCNEFLKQLNFDENVVHNDLEETKKEFDLLSDYRKFCINSHLTLSEHSLYCSCIGARRDDILICTPFHTFDADFIPIMEKILNRLKSEFSLARLLFFYATQDKRNELSAYDSEVMFTELYDSESLGTKPEMIRLSFRLCFGILDKIADAICTLFDLADPKENISFERFWNPNPNKGSLKQKTRWHKINSIYNISLIALYTQATDLNSSKGEWSFFKKWRNALEHNQLTLLTEKELGDDIFAIYKNNPDILVVDEIYFQSKTLQMLQFTRSAIFNFVFLVRNEAGKAKPKEGRAIKYPFRFRNDNDQ
ncbi:MAG: LA2681 family HEPN domain-containing protein [Ignavibacteriaceae bacterium]